MYLYFTIAALFSLLSNFAFAGGTIVGNGGDAVVCQDRKIEMLDTFELRVFQKRNPTLDSSIPDFAGKITNVLQKLQPISPLRGGAYQLRFQELLRNTTFVNTDLIDIPDSQHSLLPVGCEIKQIAIQDRNNGQIFLTINRPLWDRLDEDNRAVLYLHELAYAEAIDHGAVNSIEARYFNGVLLSLPADLTEFIRRVDYKPFVNAPYPIELTLASGDILLVNKVIPAELESARGNKDFSTQHACGVSLFGFSHPFDTCHDLEPERFDPGHNSYDKEAIVKGARILTFWPLGSLTMPMDGTSIGLARTIKGFDFQERKFWSTETILVPVENRSIPCQVVALDQPDLISTRRFRFAVPLIESCRPNAQFIPDSPNIAFKFMPPISQNEADFVFFTRDVSLPSRPVVGMAIEPFRYSKESDRKYVIYPEIRTDRGPIRNLGWWRIAENYTDSTVEITNHCANGACPSDLSLLWSECQLDGVTKLQSRSGSFAVVSMSFTKGCRAVQDRLPDTPMSVSYFSNGTYSGYKLERSVPFSLTGLSVPSNEVEFYASGALRTLVVGKQAAVKLNYQGSLVPRVSPEGIILAISADQSDVKVVGAKRAEKTEIDGVPVYRFFNDSFLWGVLPYTLATSETLSLDYIYPNVA